MPKTIREKSNISERKESVLLLRFRTAAPTVTSYKYMSYAKVAKIVGLTYNQV